MSVHYLYTEMASLRIRFPVGG